MQDTRTKYMESQSNTMKQVFTTHKLLWCKACVMSVGNKLNACM